MITEKKFIELYNQYHSLCYLKAYYYMRDSEDALDVVSDTFIHIWEKRKTLSLNKNEKDFLLYSIKNKCHDRLASKKVYHKHIENYKPLVEFCTSDPEENLKPELLQKVNKALKDVQRPLSLRCFRLQYEVGLMYKDIAKVMNMAPGTVRNNVSYVIKHIKSYVYKGQLSKQT